MWSADYGFRKNRNYHDEGMLWRPVWYYMYSVRQPHLPERNSNIKRWLFTLTQTTQLAVIKTGLGLCVAPKFVTAPDVIMHRRKSVNGNYNLLLGFYYHYFVILRFTTTIFYRGVPGFVTNCPFGGWCRGLTTCLLWVGPCFLNLIWNTYIS